MDASKVLTLLPEASALVTIGDTALRAARAVHKKKLPDLESDPDQIAERLKVHLLELGTWADEIRVDPKSEPRTVSDMFVDLDLDLLVRDGRSRRMKVSSLVSASAPTVILGQPGGGKTTSLKYIGSALIERRCRSREAAIPVLVRFRDLEAGKGLVEFVSHLFGDIPDAIKGTKRAEVRREFVHALLREQPICLLLDGLDEVPSASLEKVLSELSGILRSTNVGLFLTCRSAEYRVSLPKVRVTEILGLSEQQVSTLAHRWVRDPVDTERFLEQLARNPYAGSEVRPLALAVLALLFLRKGEIPEQPRTVYEKILRLFLEDWDESRFVKRTSRYAGFTISRKEEFLESLAFALTRQGVRGSFSHADLVAAYNAVHRRFDLPSNQAQAVAREIESHTGLVVALSYDEFEFFHLTVQEYLTARYLGRRGDLATSGLRLQKHPNELAVATAWSSDPPVFLLSIIRGIRHLSEDRQTSFWTDGRFVGTYLDRLAMEAPNWERGQLLGLGLVHLGHYFCSGVGTEADLDSSPLMGLVEDNEVRASLRLFLGRFLISSPTDECPSANCQTFRILDHKIREHGSEQLRMALREAPLPEKLFVPRAFVDNSKPKGA